MVDSLRSKRRRGGAHGQQAFRGLLVLTLVSMLAAAAAIGARPAATGAQDDALETASVTPETALLYAAVNLDTASDQFAQSQALLERAGLGDLIAPEPEDEISDDDLADLEPFLGGEAALVVTSFSATDQLPLEDLAASLAGSDDPSTAVAEVTEAVGTGGFSAVVRAPDPDAAFDKALELIAERADETGADVETAEYEGVEITLVPGSDDGTSESMAVARVGDFIVLAAMQADIEPIVDVEAGRTSSLAESESFTRLRGELNDEFMLWAYVNGPALTEGMTADATNEDLANVEFLLGDGLTVLDAYTGIVLFAADVGFRLDTISIPTGDAALPGGGNFDSSLAERVPGDTLLYVNGVELGANPLLQAVGLAFAQAINGEEAGVMPEGVTAEDYADEQYEQAASLLGFNLKSELLDQLTGEFAIALSISNLLSPDGIGGVIVSTVADSTTVADAVSSVALIVASALGESSTASTRQIGDDTVNVVEDTSSGIPLRFEYGVVGDQLIIGLGNGLQQLVDGPDEPLADNPTYQAVMAELPTEYGASAYVDLAQVIALVQFFLGTSTGASSGEDAAPECAEYASQEEAQTAYDADPGSLIDLDQDFDGEACEDFFADDGEASAGGAPDLSAIQALGHVQFERDDLRGSSTILYISE